MASCCTRFIFTVVRSFIYRLLLKYIVYSYCFLNHLLNSHLNLLFLQNNFCSSSRSVRPSSSPSLHHCPLFAVFIIYHGYLVRKWASFRPFFRSHYFFPQIWTMARFTLCDRGSGRLQTQFLLLDSSFYLSQTMHPSSYPLDLNFFLSHTLTGRGCLGDYLFRFYLSFDPSCSCVKCKIYFTSSIPVPAEMSSEGFSISPLIPTPTSIHLF